MLKHKRATKRKAKDGVGFYQRPKNVSKIFKSTASSKQESATLVKAKSLDINQQSTIPAEQSQSKMSIESAICTKSTMSFENMFDDINDDELENIQKCILISKKK